MPADWRQVAIGGGEVDRAGERWRFALPTMPAAGSYSDAQIDDVGGRRRGYPWRPGSTLCLEARFSHGIDTLRGTSGFGFWNAPFGDPTVPWPALPQATWYFFASPPTDLPLPARGPGRGWFASTIDAATWPALRLAPIALPLLLAHQVSALRRRLWPVERQQLGISFQTISVDITDWHRYELSWETTGCRFVVDGRLVLETDQSPRGPLAFVCWLDNQFLALTRRGRLRAGTVALPEPQWLEVRRLKLAKEP